jgi:hypothetical protein
MAMRLVVIGYGQGCEIVPVGDNFANQQFGIHIYPPNLFYQNTVKKSTAYREICINNHFNLV